jgi:hypothetical protein
MVIGITTPLQHTALFMSYKVIQEKFPQQWVASTFVIVTKCPLQQTWLFGSNVWMPQKTTKKNNTCI